MFNKIKIAAFDLDGTVYYGSKIIDGALDVITKLREKGVNTFFLTNNSAGNRERIYKKLIKLGVPCEESDVITAGYAAACFAKEKALKNLYISGTNMLKQEFSDLGVEYTECEETAENLIIGFDPEITFEKLTRSVRAGLHAKHIFTCNVDRTYPGEEQKRFPGCGAMTAAIEWCCNKKSEVMIGKPGTYMLDLLCSKYGIATDEIVMIGDTYESDITMANKKGC
ncbi:MAG: HAD hydrolase-like protein, partial [Clostridia bacterium]|nr:HAD hydrolase-like protein [Clostridia bacterium]